MMEGGRGGKGKRPGASRTPPPYNYGAWGLLPNYTPISAHSDNFVRKIQRFVRSRLQGAAGYCTIIRANVQNVPDKMTKKRPL